MGGSVNPTLHPPPRAGSLSLLSPGSVPKGCPQCHHIPEGVMSLNAPPWHSCGIQRDASAPGMSSKGCPWCHHTLKGISLLPASTPSHCPHCDMPPNGHIPRCVLGGSQRDVPAASMSPMSAPHRVPKMMCLPPPCPKTEVPTAGVAPRGCLCCHHVPKGVHPLPWSVLEGVPALLWRVPKGMCLQPALLCVPRGLHPPPAIPCVLGVSRRVSPVLLCPQIATPAASVPAAGQTTMRGPGRGGAGRMQMRVAVN